MPPNGVKKSIFCQATDLEVDCFNIAFFCFLGTYYKKAANNERGA